jgi:hypothetical protein
LTLVDPPSVPQAVLLAAISDELPDAAGTCTGKRSRLKRAFCLREVDQILRHPFFAQDAGDHVAIAARAPQTSFHDGSAPWCLEKIKKRKHLIIHRQREIVRDFLCSFLGANFQARVDRESHLRNFINRRWNSWSFIKTVSSAKSLQLISVYGICDAAKNFV